MGMPRGKKGFCCHYYLMDTAFQLFIVQPFLIDSFLHCPPVFICRLGDWETTGIPPKKIMDMALKEISRFMVS